MMSPKKTVVTICAATAMVYGAMTPLQKAIAEEVKKPNFVTIVLDDMGYSDLEIYGGEASTPNIDELAAGGILLNNFHAAAVSTTSRSMLFTGKDNHPAGVGNMPHSLREEQKGQPGYEGVLSLDALPFPEVLQDNDYYSIMIGKWDMGEEEEYFPINRGFDATFALVPGGDTNYLSDSDQKGYILEDSKRRSNPYNENGETADLSQVPPGTLTSDYFTDKAIELLDKRDTSKPFYLNLSNNSQHVPWQAPSEVTDKYVDTYAMGWDKIREQRFNNLKERGLLRADLELPPQPKGVTPWDSLSPKVQKLEARRMAVYTAALEVTDKNIGRLIQHLKDIGEYDNTVFFVYSDNGAELGLLRVEPGYQDMHDKNEGDGPYHEYVNGLSDTDYNDLLDNLGGPKSWIGPNLAWGAVSSMPFNGYKSDTRDGGVRGAAFVTYPNAKVNLSGLNYSCLLSVMDIAPTILEMGGMEYPTTYNGKPNAPMQGVSMAGIFDGQLNCNPERWIGFEWDGVVGLRQGNWKLSQEWSRNVVSLFNLWDDPFERNDLSKENPAKLEEMLALYQEYATINQVMPVNGLRLPNLVDTEGLYVRAGTTENYPNPNRTLYSEDATVASMTDIIVAGEIRPKSEHLGMSADVLVKGSYTVPGEPELAFWVTEEGISFDESPVPFNNFSELPSMITIPIFNGQLSGPATIEIVLGYNLYDNGTWIGNDDKPMKLEISN